MLHLVQWCQGYVSPEGVTLCAEELGLTKAEVGAVATFYTMYKRRPTGRHLVSVCTNTLCSVLGGQRIMDALSGDLGVHHDETDRRRLDHPRARRVPGRLRLRAGGHRRLRVLRPAGRRERPRARGGPAPRREAAADPRRPADRLQGHLPPAGRVLPVRRTPPPRPPPIDAPGALGPTLVGLRLAEERGESAPDDAPAVARPRPPAPRAAEAAGVESAKRGAPEPAGRSLADRNDGTDTPAGTEPGTGQAPPPSPAREGLTHASHSRAHHPLGRRQVLAAGDLRATRGLRAPCGRRCRWRPTSSSRWSRTPACAAAAAPASRPA